LKYLFPDEFKDEEEAAKLNIAKQLLMAKAEMLKEGGIEKARLAFQVKRLEAELEKDIEKHTVNERIIKIYQGFEKLVFMMSKQDGSMNVNELKKMNTMDFYSYKNNLMQYNKPKEVEE
jgi:hypothetical protein